MPSKERLADFIATVVRNEHVEAIERFYAPQASMQENNAAPRVGRDVLVAHEKAVLERFGMETEPPGEVVHDGDQVVIRWVFHMTARDGRKTRFEELALQHWEGDFIVRERFFYDPGQRG